jgi:tRNA-dihydrouridine synthase
LTIVLAHLEETLAFYGEAQGMRIFRKHLGWYIQNAPAPIDLAARREAKARLCRSERPADVERDLVALWGAEPQRLAA